MKRFTSLFSALALGTLPSLAESTDPVDFARDVLPILSDHCFQCHGPDAKEGRKGNLRLDVEADVLRARDPFPAVTPGEPAQSLLVHRITTQEDDERMPPPELGRPLSPNQITTLRQWIRGGAAWGQHWAFERVQRPPMETTDRHPVDVLVERVLAQEGFSPQPKASRRTLIRRLKLDLTGLPPTPVQVERFLNDEADGAWSRLVDRALNDPAFGERMAWDWLAAARYADSNGYQGDRDRTMWPWRDWVVRAFNENLPFDQFTIWQLAGDLLPDPTADQILATGFNRNHMINGEGGRIPEENRVDYVMDMTETMGTVWLGLTLNCCRCHDHKFDPLTQREYYQFTAFFNQTPVTGGGGDPQTPPILAVPSTETVAAMAQCDADEAQALTHLQQAETSFASEASSPKALQKPLGERKEKEWKALSDWAQEAQPEYAEQVAALQKARARKERLRAAIPKVMVMKDQEERRPTYLLDRGLYNQPREEVWAQVPESLPPLENQGERLNRLDLAQWLVSRDHPLTARVTVNRFWQQFFGIGLVKTSEDFGLQAEYPLQRELLDWLAAEFMESGWDVKHLIRLIVTSETYQRDASLDSAETYQQDPDNRGLARGPRFRMPSWMIRDHALAASGLLDTRVGGQPVYPYQPEGVWSEATFGKRTYPSTEGEGIHRRSLYTFWRRIVGPTLFFDAAKRQVCEVKPLRTNTPMHALTTLNGVTYVESARALAARTLKQPLAGDDPRFDYIGERILGRPPAPSERKLWHRSLQRARTAFADDPTAAEAFRATGESPSAPGDLPAIEHAAWAALCLNVLNLDEALTKE